MTLDEFVKFIFGRLDCFFRRLSLEVPAVTSIACLLILDNVEGTLKLYCLEEIILAIPFSS